MIVGTANNRSWLVVLLALTASQTLAQTPPQIRTTASPATAAPLEEVIVTAQKRAEKLQDVPIAITVVTAKQLTDQHVYTLEDLARTAPGLEVVQAFGGPGGGGQIRGIGTNSFSRTAEGAVGVVVDGVPQGDANADTIFDVQQIEVLRGPQGTLFGLTASAGVINMVTVAPDPARFESKLHVDYSNKNTAGSRFGEQTIRGVFNMPLSGESALRVSANFDTNKGVQRNAFNGVDNKRDDYGVRARYLLKASDTLAVNLIADYSRFTANYNDPQFTYVYVQPGPLAAELAACGITASFANQSRCSNQSNHSSGRNLGLSAQFDWHLTAGTLTSITGYRNSDTGPNDTDIMSTPGEFIQVFGTGDESTHRQISQELRLSSRSGQTFEYTVGVFYSDFMAHADRAPGGSFNVGSYQIAPFFINFVKSADTTDTTNKAAAVFGQLSYHSTEQLTWIAGARFTSQRLHDTDLATDFTTTPQTTTVNPAISKSITNVSGKLGAQYKFNGNLTGYVTATRGYKGPQVQSANGTTPAVVVNAEIPMAFEAGLKGALLEGHLSMDASVFKTNVKDYQGQRCRLDQNGVLNCVPESVDVDTQGIELDLYGRPAAGLILSGGFIYNQARYPSGWTGYNPNDLRDPNTDPNTGIIVLGPGTTSLSRAQLVAAPKSKLTFAIDYTTPLGTLMGFMGADTVYKSDLRLGPSGDPRFIYPAHWTTGIRFGVRATDDRWSVSVFGRNLSDEHEPSSLFGGPGFIPPNPGFPTGQANGISGWINANSLRQVGLSVDVKF